ncbi:MAG: hypothetical protein LBK07_07890 [Tannerella sp.]|nr:hypothetical protein [Tannerella sp.]
MKKEETNTEAVMAGMFMIYASFLRKACMFSVSAMIDEDGCTGNQQAYWCRCIRLNRVSDNCAVIGECVMLKTEQKVRKVKMEEKRNLASPIVFAGILEQRANAYPAGSCGSAPPSCVLTGSPGAAWPSLRFMSGAFVPKKEWMRSAGFAAAIPNCRCVPALSEICFLILAVVFRAFREGGRKGGSGACALRAQLRGSHGICSGRHAICFRFQNRKKYSGLATAVGLKRISEPSMVKHSRLE